MGVLNVTPDSFSDGGRYLRLSDAIEHGLALAAEGANIIDVGGESTRPGAQRVAPELEIARVEPVIRALSAEGVPVSIDTMNAATALAAADAGAQLINDVSGGLADPQMADAVIQTGLRYIVMHWRGQSDTMDRLAEYDDAPRDVRAELAARIEALAGQGVDPERIIVDPGLGFAKNAEHNWQLLGHLSELESLGRPVLIGASRKRFLGALLPPDAPPSDRDGATAVISALSAVAGVWGVRVHDVAGTKVALDVVSAWQAGRHDQA
jgi:dihydropteroate synthase